MHHATMHPRNSVSSIKTNIEGIASNPNHAKSQIRWWSVSEGTLISGWTFLKSPSQEDWRFRKVFDRNVCRVRARTKSRTTSAKRKELTLGSFMWFLMRNVKTRKQFVALKLFTDLYFSFLLFVVNNMQACPFLFVIFDKAVTRCKQKFDFSSDSNCLLDVNFEIKVRFQIW